VNYLLVYGVPAGNITFTIGSGGNGGGAGKNDTKNTTAGLNDQNAEGNGGGAGNQGEVTTVTISGTPTFNSGGASPANAGGNGGNGGGGGYMKMNTAGEPLSPQFYPCPGSNGNSGKTPTQVTSPTPISVNFPAFSSKYGTGGNGGELGQDNGGPNGGEAGFGGAVQFIYLYD
jgi:hypothetical protein